MCMGEHVSVEACMYTWVSMCECICVSLEHMHVSTCKRVCIRWACALCCPQQFLKPLQSPNFPGETLPPWPGNPRIGGGRRLLSHCVSASGVRMEPSWQLGAGCDRGPAAERIALSPRSPRSRVWRRKRPGPCNAPRDPLTDQTGPSQPGQPPPSRRLGVGRAPCAMKRGTGCGRRPFMNTASAVGSGGGRHPPPVSQPNSAAARGVRVGVGLLRGSGSGRPGSTTSHKGPSWVPGVTVYHRGFLPLPAWPLLCGGHTHTRGS